MGLLEAHAALAGKIAVVVGGAYGVGRGVTLGLAKAGIHIAMCDNDEEALRAITPELKALVPKVLTMNADVCDAGQLDRFFDRVEAEFGRIDILVNVAGAGMIRQHFMESTREQDARDIRLNYGYVLDSIRRAVPLIRKGGKGGSIINFTTIEAYRGAANYSVYAGAKAATTNFSRALAVELGAEQIRVNCIAPDTTPARGSYSCMPPEKLAEFSALSAEGAAEALAAGFEMYIPQKKAPTVEDVADGVLVLASDLSRTITGTTLHVDGGTIAALGFLDWPFGDGFGPAPLGGTLRQLFARSKS